MNLVSSVSRPNLDEVPCSLSLPLVFLSDESGQLQRRLLPLHHQHRTIWQFPLSHLSQPPDHPASAPDLPQRLKNILVSAVQKYFNNYRVRLAVFVSCPTAGAEMELSACQDDQELEDVADDDCHPRCWSTWRTWWRWSRSPSRGPWTCGRTEPRRSWWRTGPGTRSSQHSPRPATEEYLAPSLPGWRPTNSCWK